MGEFQARLANVVIFPLYSIDESAAQQQKIRKKQSYLVANKNTKTGETKI